MSSTFAQAARLLFTSESVTEGHPDKLCDQVSDAILDAYLRADPKARVACETAASTGLVFVLGEITAAGDSVDIPKIVRRTVSEIGYTHSDHGFEADIKMGVDEALEVRDLDGDYAEVEGLGAGDQGMMYGYACDETPEFMPAPIALAHRAARRLAAVRKDGTLPWLRPDGKTQVTVEYRYGRPARVDTVVVAAQHADDVGTETIERELEALVIRQTIPSDWIDANTRFIVNGTGRFVIGGPMGDAGLTGRKIIVDTYGGMARHGGGAFSGKDPSKVDRSAAYAGRYVAKNIVAAGLAKRCEIQVSYAIGTAEPTSVGVNTFGTGTIAEERIVQLIRACFDLKPRGLIDMLDLKRPIYRPTAAYGHFGREEETFTWERTDKAEELRAAVNGA